jgi:hypothetical protein
LAWTDVFEEKRGARMTKENMSTCLSNNDRRGKTFGEAAIVQIPSLYQTYF